uniref:DNA mismatch repair protein S5 domain-containing protein n=1 Tax=Romanomermis culicivorax TaxID=13658 RepID=A0A915KMR6_ROMCU
MSNDPPKILQLPEIVVSRIAAGEIINRPANIVKELIENSLDAGANQITVSISDGGLKLISVLDNGCGIRQEDLEILCQRFTTSKLRSYEDLQSIGTYGFRGEALASASHVSHLSVVTRCVSSQVGFKAEFIDGTLKSKPKPCAANQGTLIKVEELFYNMPIRRKALRCAKEEYAKCLDIVTKYAFHSYTVSFLMRRLTTNNDQSSVDVRTSHADATLKKNLSILMGPSVAKDVLTFQVQNDALSFHVNGLISHPNYAGRKFNLVLFINNRLVECDSLKRGLELVTSQILPKGNLPFIYIDLSIEPRNVDVNVHPTKSQVHFLHESLILKALEDAIEKKLTLCNDSRTFYVGQIPSTPRTMEFYQIDPSSADNKVYDHELVRMDAKKRKLEEFFVCTPLEKMETVQVNFFDTAVNVEGIEKETGDEYRSPCHEITEASYNQIALENMDVQKPQCSSAQDLSIRQTDPKPTNWPKRNLKLASIHQLKRQIQDRSSPFTTSLFKEHTVVGCIDARLALIQYKTSLYLVDTTKLSIMYFYQRYK